MRAASRLAALAASLGSATCGSPAKPTPIEPPPPNSPPAIESLAVSQPRIEVDQSLQLTATVVDEESSLEQLTFEWSSATGSFTGQGATVTWQPPANFATPADPVLTLTVVENYSALEGGSLVTRQHRVAATATVRVHNSRKELGDMGVGFLAKFANSTVSPEACLVDFNDGCAGKEDELDDIESNRSRYVIRSSTLGTPVFTSVDLYNDAEMLIPCAFESRIIKCLPGDEAWGCVVGWIERVSGDCRLTGVYDQSRWWLCVSNFVNGSGSVSPTMKKFFEK
jgi:hypothetical protein